MHSLMLFLQLVVVYFFARCTFLIDAHAELMLTESVLAVGPIRIVVY